MASVVSQGLQSCLEPQITQSCFLTHKTSSKPTQSHQKPKTEANSVIDNDGERANKNSVFTFFDVLENPSSNCVKSEDVYVHPMVKRSASALSTMSLEMCTESLGTETGSDVSESSDEFNWEERERFRDLQRSKARNFYRKVVSNGGFPPPLTSISGSDGTVKVRPHRENGRLVIRAVSVSDCGTKFEAERTNGRLRLSLLKVKNDGGQEEHCDGYVEEGGSGMARKVAGDRRNDGGKTGIRRSKRPSKLNKAVEDATEFRLSGCKGDRNENRTFGNWDLFRVVIS